MHKAFRSVTTSKANYYRVVTPLVFIVALSGVAGCGSDGKSNATNTSPASNAPPSSSTSAGPSTTGVAPAPAGDSAARDVIVGKRVTSGLLGSASVELTVTNRSSQPSDYAVELALVSANGTQLETKTAFVDDVGPGKSSTRPVNFLQSYNAVPAGARVTLRTVQRYPLP